MREGGGAIIAPFCVAVLHLPVYTAAGTALFGIFLTSVVGVIFYSILTSAGGISTSPDRALGFLFGIGGFGGMYVGARLQKYAPPETHQGHAWFSDRIVVDQIYISILRDKLVVRKSR
jgi:hypothetical protein